jgi:hypothetical protein
MKQLLIVLLNCSTETKLLRACELEVFMGPNSLTHSEMELGHSHTDPTVLHGPEDN